jgi:hypothetical protein
MLDVMPSLHGFHTMDITATHIAPMPAFDNLGGDSSPDVHGNPSPKRTGEKRVFSPPLASSEFLH